MSVYNKKLARTSFGIDVTFLVKLPCNLNICIVQEADLKEAFKIFDRDKDGFIDMKELKKVIYLVQRELRITELESSKRIKDYRTLDFREDKRLQNSIVQRR